MSFMSTSVAAPARTSSASVIERVGRVMALLGLAVVLAFYTELLTRAPVAGQDFRNFYAAATILRQGGNPYDSAQLVRAEVRLYRPSTPAERRDLARNPYVQGPLLAAAFMPFVGHATQTVYRIYAAILVAVALAALAALARLWSPGRKQSNRKYVALLLVSPVTFAGILLGQPDAVLLLVFVGALWSIRRHPSLAGALLTVGLIKPQIIVGPIILLAILAWKRKGLAWYTLGLFGGLTLFAGGSVLVAGPAVVGAWLRGLSAFGGATVYSQVDIASLSTLYVDWVPHLFGALFAVLSLLGWAVLLATTWRISRTFDETLPTTDAGDGACGDTKRGHGESPFERWWLALGLTTWLLATPYAHPHDDVLLLPAVWYLFNRAPWRGATRALTLLAIMVVVSWWLLPMTSVVGLRPPIIRGLGIVPVVLLAILLVCSSLPHMARSVIPNRAIGRRRIPS